MKMDDNNYIVLMHYTAIKVGGKVERWADAVTNTTSMMALMDAVKAAMHKLSADVDDVINKNGYRLICADSFSLTYETDGNEVVSIRYEVVRS